jgi:hypothetical protein
MYSLCEAEILTNLLYDTNGKYLGKGSDYFYFLVSKDRKIKERKFNDIIMYFDVEDVEIDESFM